MAEIPPADAHATEYVVSCLPREHRAHRHFSLRVQALGDRWAVTDGGEPLGLDGQPVSPMPSETREEWQARSRFDLDTALDLARRVAPTLVVNGRTVADVLFREEQPDA